MLNSESGNGSVGLSKAETELYDRQIRLWGIEAQKKLRVANGLVCGLCGVGAEMVKNLMLCGLRSLTLMDDRVVTREDFDSNFLIDIDSLGNNRARASSSKAQALNPMVKLEVVESGMTNISSDFLSQFSLVVLCDQMYDVVVKCNDMCRDLNIRFISCNVFGWMGYAFFDFNNHFFLSAVGKKQEIVYDDNDVDNTSHTNVALDVEEDIVKKVLLANLDLENQSVQPEKFDYFFGPQLSPVCAIVGGLAGQEAIKALSENEHPLSNVFIYSALDSTGIMCRLPSLE
ncbi:ThiF family protein [Dictyocaulus viviparus]|uniref:SUMO-activating enzyme subunit 1 n=1 Tax=Dictyocaulus viviparus TaxID=29172 RepID=A0A0D8Y1I7_DICVI|nr:ThiF family protein [Dictyocaulus viviparus]